MVIYEIKGWSFGNLTEHYDYGDSTEEYELLYLGLSLGTYSTWDDGTHANIAFYGESKHTRLYFDSEAEYKTELEVALKGKINEDKLIVRTLYKIRDYQNTQGADPLDLKLVLNYERAGFDTYTLREISKKGEETSNYTVVIKGRTINY